MNSKTNSSAPAGPCRRCKALFSRSTSATSAKPWNWPLACASAVSSSRRFVTRAWPAELPDYGLPSLPRTLQSTSLNLDAPWFIRNPKSEIRNPKSAMRRLARFDHAHVWHPFTQMRDWLRREPIVIVSGRGAMLRDAHGREYLDANSSIWTNLHGHNHPKLNAAIARQLRKIAHSSALGLANEPASLLAERLVGIANCRLPIADSARPRAASENRQSPIADRQLTKVFFSDDGATAMEVALKLAYEFARRARGLKRPRFLSLGGAYHGDTVGAVSLGHIPRFHESWRGLTFKTDEVMAPYCYRCPFNRAKPERADAREYRRCNWECVGEVEARFATRSKRQDPFAAMVVEPLVQGAAGIIAHPQGWLRRVAEIVRGHASQLIADEVMTGFGRTGAGLEDGKTGKREDGRAPPSRFPV